MGERELASRYPSFISPFVLCDNKGFFTDSHFTHAAGAQGGIKTGEQIARVGQGGDKEAPHFKRDKKARRGDWHMKPELLKAWLARKKIKQSRISDELGVSKNLVWRTVNGVDRNYRVLQWLVEHGYPESRLDFPQKRAA